MIKINSYVGIRIRAFRKAKGLTQADLGELVDLPQPYVGGIERGERNISLDTLQKLLEALHITPTDLFRDYDNRSEKNKDITEILERINMVLSTRSVQEVEIVEGFINDIFKTLDDLKNIQSSK
ncbi:helix-turn-helix domain-containing protein [Paenibacillus sp. NPDC093718]|uniref:helix-turn-helix domain-containing protein n=1 Tax=Paenibacillus sp. NPDC093718 TaxID=3390601 RepID=UPI003D06825C